MSIKLSKVNTNNDTKNKNINNSENNNLPLSCY